VTAKTSNWAIRIPLLCAALAAAVVIALYNYTLLPAFQLSTGSSRARTWVPTRQS
jgi:hypothetical protein